MNIEQQIAILTNGKPNNLTFEFNEHWTTYDSPETAIKEFNEHSCPPDYIELEKMIAQNSIWVVRWYARTPISFYEVAAPTLEQCLQDLLESKEGQENILEFMAANNNEDNFDYSQKYFSAPIANERIVELLPRLPEKLRVVFTGKNNGKGAASIAFAAGIGKRRVMPHFYAAIKLLEDLNRKT